MKKKHTFILGFIVIAVVLLWWMGNNYQTQQIRPTETRVDQDKQKQKVQQTTKPAAERDQPSPAQSNQTMSPAELEAYGRNAIAEQAARNEEFKKQWNAQWDTPIHFSGKVVDENKIPVADAFVEFKWTNAEGEGRNVSTTSDGSGLFSLEGIQGAALNVHVSKVGYYTSKRLNQTRFLYADMTGREIFTPNSSNPVIFHLKKKGPGVDLITSDYGVVPSLKVQMLRDGTPVRVDFLNRKVNSNGQLEITQKKPPYENWKTATEWSLRLQIADGGFVKSDEEFSFEAPEKGYQPVIEFDFRVDQPDWKTSFTKCYYFVFGNPPRYGHLEIDDDIMWSGPHLKYAINPDGSRNLEPAENPQSKQTVFE